MRLFQNGGTLPSYRPRLKALTQSATSFRSARSAFLNDRFGAPHFLKPVLDNEEIAFFTNGDDEFSQRLWAREQGIGSNVSLDDILLAQIESHKTEVFYNLDPMRFGNSFLRRLPGHVRKTIAWRAAPSAGGQFFEHDLIVNNFPSILKGYEESGARVAYFSPAHDPAMDDYSDNSDRPIDILFVGTYSRHHYKRARLLDNVASLRNEASVALHIDKSRFTALAESPIGMIGPLRRYRRSKNIIATSKGPLFGRELLEALSLAKIVLNGAIDMSGVERGNLRIWEAMGCGAVLLSDAGSYPRQIKEGEHFAAYRTAEDALSQARALLSNETMRIDLATAGNRMIRRYFSKDHQWETFQNLAS